jgi:hypothetical protein
MRVSLGFLILGLIACCVASENVNPGGASSEGVSSSFDQMGWNRYVGEVLVNIWSSGFGTDFTPIKANNRTRETRIATQTHRLRAQVAARLLDSLETTEIICQNGSYSEDAFLQVEKELKEKGWDIHWIPKRLTEECGPQSRGFLFVQMK